MLFNKHNQEEFNCWDVSQFVDPEYRGKGKAAEHNLYYGYFTKEELETFCDGAIHMAWNILVRVGTTGTMCDECCKGTFEIIAEGDRRGLFTSDQLDAVMSVLCEAQEDEQELDLPHSSDTIH
jgi:hypothetical protein